MDLEAEVVKEIWLVLQKLKKYSLLTPSDEYIKYGIAGISSIEDEAHRKILYKLQASKAIKIKSEAYTDNRLLSAFNNLGYPSFYYKLELVEEFFEPLFKKYSELNEGAQITYKVDAINPKLLIEIDCGELKSYSDGTIKFNEKNIELTSQQRELCRLFMKNINISLNQDEIKEQIISSKKREKIDKNTIPKHVSDLRTILFEFYKKDVLLSDKNKGYIFSPK